MIVLAVRWYLRFGLSDRDVEQLLIERGVAVDHVTIYLAAWHQMAASALGRLRDRAPPPGPLTDVRARALEYQSHPHSIRPDGYGWSAA